MEQVDAQYLGMPLRIMDIDSENQEYFRYCAQEDFRLQHCVSCDLLRCPPTTACPWCGSFKSVWTSVEGKGTVHSYSEVHHAIQPAFRDHLPYLVLLVDLDSQKGRPTAGEALRIMGSLVSPDGVLASPEVAKTVGIDTKVRMVFKKVDENIAIPLWTIDEEADQPENPWRYPIE
jgi:uncharacterized OB-fold protein